MLLVIEKQRRKGGQIIKVINRWVTKGNQELKRKRKQLNGTAITKEKFEKSMNEILLVKKERCFSINRTNTL